MRLAQGGVLAAALLLSGNVLAQQVPARTASPELEACKSTGLLALKERNSAVSDVLIDPDGVTIAKADTKVEDTAVRTIIMGDAYLERKEGSKPYRFLCLIGEKGKVLLTFFTQQ
jgi:hypothetical protein